MPYRINYGSVILECDYAEEAENIAKYVASQDVPIENPQDIAACQRPDTSEPK
jgi:hypothetical protein